MHNNADRVATSGARLYNTARNARTHIASNDQGNSPCQWRYRVGRILHPVALQRYRRIRGVTPAGKSAVTRLRTTPAYAADGSGGVRSVRMGKAVVIHSTPGRTELHAPTLSSPISLDSLLMCFSITIAHDYSNVNPPYPNVIGCKRADEYTVSRSLPL